MARSRPSPVLLGTPELKLRWVPAMFTPLPICLGLVPPSACEGEVSSE